MAATSEYVIASGRELADTNDLFRCLRASDGTEVWSLRYAAAGGLDYGNTQFNRAVQAQRQPGSAFKPFLFLTAFENGFDPDSHFTDAPISIGNWKPDNYNDRYYGDVTLREAFARSLNSVAAQLIQRVGPKRVAQTAERLGIGVGDEARAAGERRVVRDCGEVGQHPHAAAVLRHGLSFPGSRRWWTTPCHPLLVSAAGGRRVTRGTAIAGRAGSR